jgi:hypothetical protein
MAATAALAPSALAAGVSPRAVRAATAAAERVEREMRPDGALKSGVLGCWRKGSAVECTGVVKGNDGVVKWRCLLQIRVRKRADSRRTARLTDAVCVASAIAEHRRSP